MADRRNPLILKGKFVFGAILILAISMICVAFGMSGTDDFDNAKREVLLRQIGHGILQQSGDKTSRVLPVAKIGGNEFQIRFENEFAFSPDSLVTIASRSLAKDQFASDYVVSVLNCDDLSVAYGFAISKTKTDDMIACTGRKYPIACYLINVKIKPTTIATVKNKYLLGSLPIIAIVGFLFLRSVKPKESTPENRDFEIFTLGSIAFDPKTKKLTTSENVIELTATETRILRIFALSPNEIIERSRLQKEIWEDEGIVVGRSLDMFVSKLRKKLEIDTNVNIVVVRAKGYRLEIGI